MYHVPHRAVVARGAARQRIIRHHDAVERGGNIAEGIRRVSPPTELNTQWIEAHRLFQQTAAFEVAEASEQGRLSYRMR